MNPIQRIRDWWNREPIDLDAADRATHGRTEAPDAAFDQCKATWAAAPEHDDEILAIAEAAGVVAIPLPQRVPGWLDTSLAARIRRIDHERVEIAWLQQDKAGMDRSVTELMELAKVTGAPVDVITADVVGHEVEAFLEEVATR